MSEQEHEDAIAVIAGEDLATGDRVARDSETGKVIRCPQGTRCVVTLARDDRAGEIVKFLAEEA